MLTLLPCSYRARPADSDGRRHFCTHPRMCAPAAEHAVLATTCRDCEFATWVPTAAIDAYKPRRPTSPTRQQFAVRVALCNDCDRRKGNYCLRAGAACGLVTLLAKTGFECPDGVFGRADAVSAVAQTAVPKQVSTPEPLPVPVPAPPPDPDGVIPVRSKSDFDSGRFLSLEDAIDEFRQRDDGGNEGDGGGCQ